VVIPQKGSRKRLEQETAKSVRGVRKGNQLEEKKTGGVVGGVGKWFSVLNGEAILRASLHRRRTGGGRPGRKGS